MGTWNELSNEISQAVQSIGASIVTVSGRGGRTSSGIVLDQNTVVTAAHTIAEGTNIRIWTSPDQPLSARLIGRDPGTDLAVLKTDDKLAAPTQFVENPQLAVGQLVVAVARTWRGNLVASAGILSGAMAEWHTFRGRKIEAFIRPDLTLYSGFSGGALIGAEKKIIGMTTSALRRRSPLALPYSTIKRTANLLLEKGYIPSPYLGLGLQPVRLTESLKQKLNLTEHAGALVVHVEPGSPADDAGVLVGDVLTKISDGIIAEERTTSILARLAPGQKANLAGARGGQPFSATIVVGERPRRQG
jgi:serine protease DegQ